MCSNNPHPFEHENKSEELETEIIDLSGIESPPLPISDTQQFNLNTVNETDDILRMNLQDIYGMDQYVSDPQQLNSHNVCTAHEEIQMNRFSQDTFNLNSNFNLNTPPVFRIDPNTDSDEVFLMEPHSFRDTHQMFGMQSTNLSGPQDEFRMDLCNLPDPQDSLDMEPIIACNPREVYHEDSRDSQFRYTANNSNVSHELFRMGSDNHSRTENINNLNDPRDHFVIEAHKRSEPPEENFQKTCMTSFNMNQNLYGPQDIFDMNSVKFSQPEGNVQIRNTSEHIKSSTAMALNPEDIFDVDSDDSLEESVVQIHNAPEYMKPFNVMSPFVESSAQLLNMVQTNSADKHNGQKNLNDVISPSVNNEDLREVCIINENTSSNTQNEIIEIHTSSEEGAVDLQEVFIIDENSNDSNVIKISSGESSVKEVSPDDNIDQDKINSKMMSPVVDTTESTQKCDASEVLNDPQDDDIVMVHSSEESQHSDDSSESSESSETDDDDSNVQSNKISDTAVTSSLNEEYRKSISHNNSESSTDDADSSGLNLNINITYFLDSDKEAGKNDIQDAENLEERNDSQSSKGIVGSSCDTTTKEVVNSDKSDSQLSFNQNNLADSGDETIGNSEDGGASSSYNAVASSSRMHSEDYEQPQGSGNWSTMASEPSSSTHQGVYEQPLNSGNISSMDSGPSSSLSQSLPGVSGECSNSRTISAQNIAERNRRRNKRRAQIRKRKAKNKLRAEQRNKRKRRNRKVQMNSGANLEKSRNICTLFLKGECLKGDECEFTHTVMPAMQFRLCKYYLRGYGVKNLRSIFSHKKFPRKYYHFGQDCPDNENCRASHCSPLRVNSKELLFKVFYDEDDDDSDY